MAPTTTLIVLVFGAFLIASVSAYEQSKPKESKCTTMWEGIMQKNINESQTAKRIQDALKANCVSVTGPEIVDGKYKYTITLKNSHSQPATKTFSKKQNFNQSG